MAAAIVLAIFRTATLFGLVWFIGGIVNYRRYATRERRRNEMMLWFVIGPVGPMLLASTGWEERYKLHGPVLDAVFARLHRPRA